MTLFIDTSSFTLNLGLITKEKIFEKKIEEVNQHSTYAVEEINKLLKESKKTIKDIKNIMVVIGPGSFTGLRIGTTIAKTFGWALKIKVIPISSLKMKIFNYNGYDYYIKIDKQKNNKAYVGIYNKKYKTILEKHVDLNDLDLTKYNNHIVIEEDTIDIKKICEYYKNTKKINPHKIKPNYLKLSQAEREKNDKKV